MQNYRLIFRNVNHEIISKHLYCCEKIYTFARVSVLRKFLGIKIQIRSSIFEFEVKKNVKNFREEVKNIIPNLNFLK